MSTARHLMTLENEGGSRNPGGEYEVGTPMLNMLKRSRFGKPVPCRFPTFSND